MPDRAPSPAPFHHFTIVVDPADDTAAVTCSCTWSARVARSDPGGLTRAVYRHLRDMAPGGGTS
jgi:hypothetical protein